jgi:nitrate reductase delta subunit
VNRSPRGYRAALARLAPLFEYPGEGLAGQAREALAALPDDSPVTARLERFATYAADTPAGDVEDLYTRTFDLIPRCPPYVAYQLYGDTYRRGEVMARLAGLSRECGIEEEGRELPDHLSIALRVLALARWEEASDLATEVVLPALERMQTTLNELANPFADLVAAARATAREAFPGHPGKEAGE